MPSAARLTDRRLCDCNPACRSALIDAKEHGKGQGTSRRVGRVFQLDRAAQGGVQRKAWRVAGSLPRASALPATGCDTCIPHAPIFPVQVLTLWATFALRVSARLAGKTKAVLPPGAARLRVGPVAR